MYMQLWHKVCASWGMKSRLFPTEISGKTIPAIGILNEREIPLAAWSIYAACSNTFRK